MTPTDRPRRPLSATSLLLATLLAAGCSGDAGPGSDGPPPPPEPGVLLVLDPGDGRPVTVRRADLMPHDAFWARHDPSLGVDYRRRQLLDQLVLPVALARAAFPEERAAARERATRLAEHCGNALELRRRGEALGGFGPDEAFTQAELPLSVTRWALEPAHIGAVSPPLPTPRGFYVAGLEDILPGTTSAGDRFVAFVVPFFTHDPSAFDAWLAERKQALTGAVSYVHPDIAEALPAWLDPR